MGGYSDYLAQREEQAEPETERDTQQKSKDSWKTKSDKLKFTYKEQREYDAIDDVIAKLEERIDGVEKELVKEASNFERLQELMEQKTALEAELAAQMERWVYLSDLAERIEAQNQA
ncbi:ABC transporter C-terminal domain-containing protein [Hydrogenoanaerobacterium saccharovorans]